MADVLLRMNKTYASPRGTAAPGGLIRLPTDEARSLIESRQAVRVGRDEAKPTAKTGKRKASGTKTT